MEKGRARSGPSRAALRRAALATLALALLATGSGCGIGSGAIRTSRLRYNRAFQETEKQELLLNLVRLRYNDPIEMLPIASITTQFEFNGGATYNKIFGEGGFTEAGGLFDGLSISGNAAERPTVAMTPRREQDFFRRSLGPIEPETLALLRGSGLPLWQAVAMTIDAIDGLGIPPSDPNFHRAVELIDVLSRLDAIYLTYDDRTEPLSEPVPNLVVSADDLISAADRGYKFVRDPLSGATTLEDERKGLTLHFSDHAEGLPEAAELQALLNLAPGRGAYPIETVSNMPPRGPFDPPVETIRIRTRSLHDALRHLSRGIDVPEKHVAKGYVEPLDDLPGCPMIDPAVAGRLIRIRHSAVPPPHAAVAVKYRGHWFSIDEADPMSKATFRAMYLLIAAEVSAEYVEGLDRPILTIPLGDVGGD